VIGVATYAYELLSACADLDVAYVPIGLGSGISGMIGMRDALGRKTAIVGVVAERANAYRLSVEAGRVVPTNAAPTFAEGVAVRVPDPQALDIIRRGAERIVEVSEDEIAEAIRVMFGATHSLAEGAGAVALAALIKERAALKGRRAAVILSGQNFDRAMAQTVLNGETPQIQTTGDR
jgi:threonine dehydratase